MTTRTMVETEDDRGEGTPHPLPRADHRGAEPHLSPRPFIVVFLALGVLFVLLGDSAHAEAEPAGLFRLAIACYGMALALGLLQAWRPRLACWLVLGALLVSIEWLGRLIGPQQVMFLWPILIIVAAASIGVGASVLVAGLNTILVLAVHRDLFPPGSTVLIVALIAIWSVPVLMHAVYRPNRLYADWAWSYSQQAHRLLEAARSRRGELRKALDDLAHANRQLTLVNENLANLRRVAEEAQRTKTAFLSKVSHEFRTPLNMIIGLTDLLVETPEVYGESLPPKLLEHLAIVNRNCQHLAGLIDDVLDLSQIEAGRLALRRERFGLAEVLARAVSIVRPLADQKGLALETSVPDDLAPVYGDRTRIAQVVVNLLSNAARFTEHGGITLRATQHDQEIVVSVTDTGPGIAEADRNVIFEPFCQGSGGTWRDRGGSGLGLSISKQFVELHGGRLSLESVLGKGSTFTFSLPLEPPMRTTGRPGHWIVPDWQDRRDDVRPTPARLEERIVVWDETEALYTLVARFSDGTECVRTTDLIQTIEQLKECPAHAVLVNAPTPVELVVRLQMAAREVGQTPVLGFCVPSMTERATAAGARGYLIKPLTRDRLHRAIHAIEEPIRRVLIVDDGRDDRELLALYLRTIESSLEVTTAAGGEEALEALRHEPYDLVLLDVLMPGMNGWEVLAHKGQDAALCDIPVILISAEDPAHRPVMSELVVGALGEGLSAGKVLRASRQLAALLGESD